MGGCILGTIVVIALVSGLAIYHAALVLIGPAGAVTHPTEKAELKKSREIMYGVDSSEEVTNA